MSYRSEGAIWIDSDLFETLPDELKTDLKENWTKEGDGIWSFFRWKWYTMYKDIKKWEEWLRAQSNANNYEQYDFIRIGESYEDIESATGEMFSLNRSWEIN